MKGKEKCKALKELRQKIAEENDIAYAVSECTHQGDCKGTCPKCDAELRYLERELENKTRLGKTVVLAGLSACLAGVVSGCGNDDSQSNPWSGNEFEITTEPTTEPIVLEGDTEIPYDGGLEEYPDETEEKTEVEVLDGDVEYTTEPDDTEIIELEGDIAYIPESDETEESVDTEDTCEQ